MMTTRLLASLIAIAFASALSGVTSCGSAPNVHDTQEAKTNPCVHCHTSAFNAATSPLHDATFQSTCEDCHNQKAWAPIEDFHDLPSIQEKACVGCHQKEYDKTTQPVHAPVFPTDCKDCHGTDQYKPLARDIHTTATFGKTGCYDCHKTQYDLTTSPNHKTSGFSTLCGDCHKVGGPGWVPKGG